jgi:hypothetical protein
MARATGSGRPRETPGMSAGAYRCDLLPRQLPTRLRHGNSTRQFHHLDQFVVERLARFIARKHGSRNWRRGKADLIESRTTLGLHRLAGTVRYATAHATR